MVFEIKWTLDMIDVYKSGSTIEFNKNGYVRFQNNLLSPGTSIVKWISNPVYQYKSSLLFNVSLLRRGKKYHLSLNIETAIPNSILLTLDCFDFSGKKIASKTFLNNEGYFVYPWRAHSYSISLISTGVKKFIFKNIEV